MPTLLIFTLGNRDLQITAEMYEKLNSTDKELFETNQSDKTTYSLKKDSILTFSEQIFENPIPEIEFKFVFYENTIAFLKKNSIRFDKIVLTTSRQNPQNIQDCYYIALMLKRHINNAMPAMEIITEFCEHNPNSFEELFKYYFELLENYSKTYKLIISNTGGTPTMRQAIQIAGFFKQYQYISFKVGTDEPSSSFAEYENRTLKDIVVKMLDVYDYEGVSKLPVSASIYDLCTKATKMYNLETDIIQNEKDYDKRALKAIEFIVNNMYVCFKQGRYADVIGRLFRIEEGIGQFLLYKEFLNKGVNRYDLTEVFEKNNNEKKQKIIEKNFLSEKNVNKYGKFGFTNYEKKFVGLKILISGKNLYYFLFRELKKYKALYGVFEKINSNYPSPNSDNFSMTTLRNQSMLGHGSKGISKNDIERLVGSDFYDFYKKFVNLLEKELNLKITQIFDDINLQITKLLV